MKIAISLIWIRHKVAGGVESFTRNLLDGFVADGSDNTYVLLCSKDNVDSFRKYSEDKRFTIYECPVLTNSLKQTLFFESFKLDNLVSSMGVDLCFVPSFRMPLLGKKNKYVVVIHDLISSNMPQMFKWYRRAWLNWATKRAWRSADYVVTISNFVAEDLTKRFGQREGSSTIYNPILPNKDKMPFDTLEKKYGISERRYFYTVSSLAPNKNLFTLLKMMRVLSQEEDLRDIKLLISGVGLTKDAKSRFDVTPLLNYLEENNIQNRCFFTGFVSNEERNTLIANCNAFLFPSVFEGFGMPVIEALELGAKVVTTQCASIPEVSQGKAVYVNNPYDECELFDTIMMHFNETGYPIHYPEYDLPIVTKKYLCIFNETLNGNVK